MRRNVLFLKILKKTCLSVYFIVGLAITNGYFGNVSMVSASEDGGRKTIVKTGDKVKVHYTISLKDGTVFDKSKEGKPMELEVGNSQIPRGFNSTITGMKLDEEKKVVIESKDAYGKRDETLVMTFERTNLPKSFEPKLGKLIKFQGIAGTIVGIQEKDIILDGNHPLAGKDVVLDVQVVGIK